MPVTAPHRDHADLPDDQVEDLVAFARQVVSEDARVCELNQQGLRCSRHQGGVLLGLEDSVFEFEQWVRERLSRGPGPDGSGKNSTRPTR